MLCDCMLDKWHIGNMLNTRDDKIQPLSLRFKVCLRNYGQNGPEINKKKKRISG